MHWQYLPRCVGCQFIQEALIGMLPVHRGQEALNSSVNSICRRPSWSSETQPSNAVMRCLVEFLVFNSTSGGCSWLPVFPRYTVFRVGRVTFWPLEPRFWLVCDPAKWKTEKSQKLLACAPEANDPLKYCFAFSISQHRLWNISASNCQ